MDCESEDQGLQVETEQAIYEIIFGQIQIEITGVCNMSCDHCRAADDIRRDMPLDQILKVVQFGRRYSPNYKELMLSGGEPLAHRNFSEVITAVRENGGDFITLTTNGSLLTPKHLELFAQLKFQRLMLSVSLDNLDAAAHDAFRHHLGAYDKAINAIRMITEAKLPNVITSVRVTLRPEVICQMPAMAEFAHRIGCNRVSFSAIHPAGRALSQPELWMSREQKRLFIKQVYALKKQYPETFQISTNDPLKCLVRGFSDIGKDGEVVFDGCPAAAVTFNVFANGDMTPCALMNLPILNVFPLSIDEIAEHYQQSEIVKNMLDMNLKGKCGNCDKKYQCGGCRARALGRTGDYLAEDPDCWL
jgi:radical SAM protein with 4Fe4S-binding SPASM domain